MHYICAAAAGEGFHVMRGVNEPPPLSRAAAWRLAYPSEYVERRRADMDRAAAPPRPHKRRPDLAAQIAELYPRRRRHRSWWENHPEAWPVPRPFNTPLGAIR